MQQRVEAWRQALKQQGSELPVDAIEFDKMFYLQKSRVFLARFTAKRLFSQSERVALTRGVRQLMQQQVGCDARVQFAYPGLFADFEQDPSRFTELLRSLLAERSPGCLPYLHGGKYAFSEGTLTLSVMSNLGLEMLKEKKVDEMLRTVVRELFLREVAVRLESMETAQQLEAFLRERARLDEEEAERTASKQQAKAEKEEGPKLVFGHAFHSAQPSPLGELNEQSGRVCVEGFVLTAPETKPIKGGASTLLSFGLTDFTGSIEVNAFLKPEQAGRAVLLKKGGLVKIRGNCSYSKFARDIVLYADDAMVLPHQVRADDEPEKRVELHLHTKMSNMDGVTDAKDLIERAAYWGHEAVAITDHGVVQAFPEAFDTLKKLKKAGKTIKLIPGMEGYLIDDSGVIVQDADQGPLQRPYVVLDIETTGLKMGKDRILELAAVKIQDGKIQDEFSTFVDPEMRIPPESIKIHGIRDDMVEGAPKLQQVMERLADFAKGHVVCAHNASFDLGFLRLAARQTGVELPTQVLDTLSLSRALLPELKSHKLDKVCKRLGVALDKHHRALFDTRATALMLDKLLTMAKEERGLQSLSELNERLGGDVAASKTSYHIVVLAKNQKGLENLYRLVSDAHLKHFDRRPNVLKSELIRHREGLILGSACEAGELFRAMLEGKSEQELLKIASFYDYLEIQPIGNNAFMLRSGDAADEEELRGFNRRILALGDRLKKPVCATCDVHFMDPQDAVFREVLMHGMGFEDASQQAPLYLRTTREMLDEFAYLGERAKEVVVDNPRSIAAMVENISMFPKHPTGQETFQPSLPNAAERIRNMAEENAKRLYGDPVPDIVRARLDKELGSIIGNGFATLYLSAHLLIKKSNEDGYLVGSRGSVGSSFVATMCSITEVNPLPPHYVCPQCQFSDFDVDKDLYPCGIDLPPRDCPVCGAPLTRTGYDIPFEVFLGFNGDKVPDIDLNFSGVYQPKAHNYVKTLFGEGNVFKAGTIGTLAEKTAYGYVKKYLAETGKHATNMEIDRLVKGCTGVKRTTGQHPGGMVIVPKEYSVYQFSPVQHPADDKNSDIVTTHFDFGSLHDILVKLDILGHDDPTMLNMLERLTGIAAKELPLNDPKVMSLFQSPEALGVTPEQLMGCPTGTLGIPEFGTKFVRQMLVDTKPSTMGELIRISGLSHGTNVWLNNAQDMVRSGTATLRECFCTRDDIMNYLIRMGVESKMAFTTMEAVRKGKKLSPEMQAAMEAVHVPQQYIDSCNKIEYMFPKAHAAAYVTMALRVAWYKVYRPIEYYTAYFTVRADEFDASIMLEEPEQLLQRMRAIDKMDKNEATARDERIYTLLELVYEMRARGLGFLPVDLYESSHNEFLIQEGRIRPPFNRLPGVGDAAAESLALARKDGPPFLSVEDLQRRSKVSTAVIETLRAAGALKGLPETSQVSLLADL